MVPRSLVVASLLVLAQPATAVLVSAAEGPVFTIETADGAPASARFERSPGAPSELAVTDDGASPAVFVCRAPRKAEVTLPKAEATIAVTQLAFGEIDAFVALPSKAAPGVIVAK